MSKTDKKAEKVVGVKDPFDPTRWGIPRRATREIAQEFEVFFREFHNCFKTRTWNNYQYAYDYMSGIMSMDSKRNFKNIERTMRGPGWDGDCIQHFISDSPWSEQAVFEKIQRQISQDPDFSGGILTIDESGDRKSGDGSAGASRQYIGNVGKKDMGQVGVVLGYYRDGNWAMVDAELYLPEKWFDGKHAPKRKKLNIPGDRVFKTKPEIGLEMVLRAKKRGLPFTAVTCDAVHGADGNLRKRLDDEKIIYMADVRCNTRVYLGKPSFQVPETPPGKQGRPYSIPRAVRNPRVRVDSIPGNSDVKFKTVRVRTTERGWLENDFCAIRVWTGSNNENIREEWLLIRKHENNKVSYSLSNAPGNANLKDLAFLRCRRYFAERIFQDSKSELGWDELEARKYTSWMHHTALTSLALWFITSMKLKWSRLHPVDPDLAEELEVHVLPKLSVSNVRELFKAGFKRRKINPGDAENLVTTHLFNRARSTRSRLRQLRKKE